VVLFQQASVDKIFAKEIIRTLWYLQNSSLAEFECSMSGLPSKSFGGQTKQLGDPEALGASATAFAIVGKIVTITMNRERIDKRAPAILMMGM